MRVCSSYCGIACVDGSCPIANTEEYVENGMDVATKCEECVYNKGCEDCCFKNTEVCTKEAYFE